MPIASADIHYRLSGGAANTDVNASLGGAESSTQVANASLHNLFDLVSSAESAAGDTEYRCIYIHNNHATLALQSAKVWINTNTPNAGSTVEIGLGAAAINAAETAVANESTAPAGVTFSAPATEGTALVIGNLPAGQYKALWVKRIITAASGAYNADSAILEVKGDTAA